MAKIVKVKGVSMTPLYFPGDYLICGALRRPPKVGDCVLARTPSLGLIVKRVRQIRPDATLLLEGIHPDSIDSIRLGPFSMEEIHWKVLCCLPVGRGRR